MALGSRSYELRLFVVAQNQASATLRRVSNDLRALQKQTDLQSRAERLGIRQAALQARQRRNLARISEFGPGGAKQLAFSKRQAAILRQQEGLQNALAGIEGKRFRTNTQLLRNRERQLRIDSQIAKTGLTRNELAQGAGGLRGTRLAMVSTANQRQMAEVSMRFGDYQAALKSVNRRIRELDLSQQKLNVDMEKGVLTVQQLTTENARLARMSAVLAREQAAVASAIRLQKWENLQNAGRTFSHMGRAAQYFGLITTAALGASAAAAANFETEVGLAATQARDLNAGLEQIPQRAEIITRDIQGLLGRFPATSQEMASSAYDIYSSMELMRGGIVQTGKASNYMTAANKIAVAGMVDLDTATDTLVTTLNNFDPTGKNVNKRLDEMFAIVRFGRMRMADFGQIMTQVAPASRAAGQSLRDVGGAVAFLTRTLGTQKTGAGLARLLEVFSNREVQRGLKAVGISITDATGNLLPFDRIIGNIVDRFPELTRGGAGLENFFKTITQLGRATFRGRPGAGREFTIQGRRAFNLLVTGARSYLDVQGDIDENLRRGSEFQAAYNSQIRTSGVQWGIFKNQLRLAVLTVGKEAIPVFKEFGGYLQRFLHWFQDLDPEQRSFIIRATAMVGVLTLVGGILTSIGAGFITLTGTLGLFMGARGLAGVTTAGEAATAAIGWSGLLGVVSKLAALGAITMIIKTAWTGDASAKDFLMGALFGGLAGARFGPTGAVIGAITVPVIMKVIAGSEVPEKVSWWQRALGADMPTQAQVEEVTGPAIDAVRRSLENAKFPGALSYAIAQNALDKGDERRRAYSKLAAEALHAGKITQQQYLLGMESVGFATPAIQAQHVRFATRSIEAARSQQDLGGEAKKVAKHATAEEREIKRLQSALDALNKTTGSGAQQQRYLSQAMREARVAAESEMNQAAANLTQTFMGIRQDFENIFGEMFQGPWLNSVFGQTADEWGIKAQIKDLTRDLREQLGEFNRFNGALRDIARRGGPPELVAELQKLGPDALDNIETLARAAPGQFNEFVNVWRQKQSAIEEATKIDFDKQLRQWYSYGKGIAQQIIFGLRSENVALDEAFRKYLYAKFPDYIAEAINKARRQEKARNAPEGLAGTGLGRFNKPAPTNQTHITENNHVTVNAQQGEATMDTARRAVWVWKNGVRTRKPRPSLPK